MPTKKRTRPAKKSQPIEKPVVRESRGVLEEADIAFNPAALRLDLDHDEKRRTTALMLAINAYKEFIIKDAEYLREVNLMAQHQQGPQVRPATMNAIVRAAVQFDEFIANGGAVIVGEAPSSEIEVNLPELEFPEEA